MASCPHPQKRSFDSEAAAIRWHGRKYPAAYGPKGAPWRAYLCACGKWHITSQRRRERRSAPDDARQ